MFNQKLDTPAIIGIAFILVGVLIMNLFSKPQSIEISKVILVEAIDEK